MRGISHAIDDQVRVPRLSHRRLYVWQIIHLAQHI